MGKKNKKNERWGWVSIVDGLNLDGSATRIRMGSAGSAQVTRCRLLATYDGIDVSSTGNMLEISLS